MSDDLRRIEELASEMIDAGCRHIHVLGWRDLEDPDSGGSEIHADHFMRRWAAAGLEITHRTSLARDRPSLSERNGYRVIRRGGRMSVFPRAVVAEVAHRMGPRDALVELWNGVPWMSPLWHRGPRLAVLHHVHGPMWRQMLPWPASSLGRVLEARLAPPFYRSTDVVTGCRGVRAELADLGFLSNRVHVVRHGVDEFFSPGGARSLNPSIVCVGRLAPVKRHDLTISAAIEARRRIPALRLVIVGEGPLRGELERQIAEAGATEWISLRGRLSDEALRDEYRAAWLVMSSSLAEGWGMSLTEAAACGTPAVATDISGHRCSVDDGTTGLLVGEEHLGSAAASLLEDATRRETMREQCLRRAGELTWDASARGILGCLAAQII
ncbi:MAG: glycosyltransferase family 4 protein [Ilumatobacteraceae bacterium]